MAHRRVRLPNPHALAECSGTALGLSNRTTWMVPSSYNEHSFHQTKVLTKYRWHILSGVGAYAFIAAADLITADDVEAAKRRLVWPASLYVDKKNEAKIK